MAPSFSGRTGRFAPNNNTAQRSLPGGGRSWRRDDSSPSRSPSPPPTRPGSELAWRRRSSSSSTTATTTSSASSRDWRAASPPAPRKTSIPTYEECRPGDVVHLPLEVPEDSIIGRTLVPNEKPWNHPVVITGKFEEDGKQCVRIRLCTSFGGQRIEKHRPSKYWNQFVLIDNKVDNTTHNSTRLTTLAPGSDKLTRRTYVNLQYDSEKSIEYKYLESWGPKLIQLDAESTQRIIDRRSS